MNINLWGLSHSIPKTAEGAVGKYELGLPETDPVYTLKKVMEELDHSGLLSRYSDKGRKGYNPIMLYAVVTYANMRGIRAVDRIVELCGRDLAFIWPTQGQRPRRDAFYEFKGSRLTPEILLPPGRAAGHHRCRIPEIQPVPWGERIR